MIASRCSVSAGRISGALSLILLCILGAQPIVYGAWTFQEAMLPLAKSTVADLALQPRLMVGQMEMVEIDGFIWRSAGRAGASAGGYLLLVLAHRQWSIQEWTAIRGRWEPSPCLRFTVSAEQRWEAGSITDEQLRFIPRWRLPLGKNWIGINDELFLQSWDAAHGWHLSLRQNRAWLFFTHPIREKLEVEAGYLNITAPHILERNRFWLAVRLLPGFFRRGQHA